MGPSNKSLVGGIAALALAAAIVVGTAAPAAGATSTCRRSDLCSERHLAQAMNEERENRGLGRLRLDPELNRVARLHSREMADAGEIEHTRPRVLRRRVTRWIILDENIGTGSDAGELHRLFMESPDHRANILGRKFTYAGVGVTERDGVLYATVLFEGHDDPGTRLRMPTCD